MGGITDFFSSVGAAINPFVPLLSGGLSLIGGERANEGNIAIAREQMEFQERMSNTAHRRQVKDLRKAGLNPILSARYGGSSSPGGAMAQIKDTLTPAINTGLQSKQNTAQVNVAEKQADLLIQSAGQMEQQKYLTKSLQALASADYNVRLKTVELLIEEVKVMQKKGQVATLKYKALEELIYQISKEFPKLGEILQ